MRTDIVAVYVGVLVGCVCVGCDTRTPLKFPVTPTAATDFDATLLRGVDPNALMRFTDGRGFSTSDVYDAGEQPMQVTQGGQLIWQGGLRLDGYRVTSNQLDEGPVWFIEGKICAEGCALEIRWGTLNGERRAYLTADYGHDNPGTLVDVEVSGGSIVARQTERFPPGTFTLAGVVRDSISQSPVEGADVACAMTTGWQNAVTRKDGTYRLPGMYDSTREVQVVKSGYRLSTTKVSINGNTTFDVQLTREP